MYLKCSFERDGEHVNYFAKKISGIGYDEFVEVLDRKPKEIPEYLHDKAYAFFENGECVIGGCQETFGIRYALYCGCGDILMFQRLSDRNFEARDYQETFRYQNKEMIYYGNEHLLRSFEANVFKHFGYKHQHSFFFKLFDLKGCPNEFFVLYREAKNFAPICIDCKRYFYKFDSVAEFAFAIQNYAKYFMED